jgi:predicted aspartyl protease
MRTYPSDVMGIFTVRAEVAVVGPQPSTFVDAGELLVDTGAEVTWIAAATLRAAGVTVRKVQQGFEMANGDAIYRDMGYAAIRAQGFETVDEVVFAEDNDLQLLGARTLEGFHARIDIERKRLVAAGLILAPQNRR